MEFRNKINARPGLTLGATAAVVVLTVILVFRLLHGQDSQEAADKRIFYSDDDGDTYFVAEATKAPPFSHNGKTAVMAEVFRCGATGKPFVGYLLKYDEKTKAQIEEAMGDPNGSVATAEMGGATLVKEPHAPHWIANQPMTLEYQAVTTPACPRGVPDRSCG